MVRKKLEMKQIENPSSRYATYSKRREGLINKASELSVLCDTDVGLLMFSPNGRLTNFGTGPNGRFENVLLRYLDSSEDSRSTLENEEYFYKRFNEMKNEGEMLGMIAKIEALEKNLKEVNSKKEKMEARLKCYEVNPEKINTILEADVYQNFLMTSLRQVQQMKAEMLSTESSSSKSRRNRLNLEPIEDENEADDNLGPHLTLHYLLKKANDGKLQIGVDKSNSNNINDSVVGDGNGNGNGKRNRSANNNRSGSASGSCNSNGGGK